MAEQAKWYVVHTYSGYEMIVTENIKKVVENRKLQDLIPEVMMPTEHSAPEDGENGGKKKAKDKNLFPSYVFVKMVMTDETWYIVRNTRGVTGFVGPGSKPIPLTDKEVEALGVSMTKTFDDAKIQLVKGDQVVVTEGKLKGMHGVVQSVDDESKTVNITIFTMGRETPAQLPAYMVEKA